MQWQEPYTVIQRVQDSNYTIQFGDKYRTYHANMLKVYVEREPEKVLVANAAIIKPEDDLKKHVGFILSSTNRNKQGCEYLS